MIARFVDFNSQFWPWFGHALLYFAAGWFILFCGALTAAVILDRRQQRRDEAAAQEILEREVNEIVAAAEAAWRQFDADRRAHPSQEMGE